MNELTQFQTQAAGLALHKLLYGDTFYISDFDKIAKLLGVQVGGRDYDAMHGLHCMKWAEFQEPFRTQIREKCVELLGLPPLVIEGECSSAEGSSSAQNAKPRLAFWRRHG